MSSTIIQADLQSLQPSALIELFVLDTTSLGGTPVYFHAGTNGLQQPIVWQGQTYQPYPIQVTGFELTGQGALPKPTMSVSNVGGLISALVMQYDDLVGAKLTRKRTFAQYLDAINSPGATLTFSSAPVSGAVVSADYADGSSATLGTGTGSQTTFLSTGQVPSAVWVTDWQGKVARLSTARTNLLTYASQIDQAAWTKTNATITANAATAPDGSLTADKLAETVTATVVHSASNAAAIALAAGTYTVSAFVKAAGRSYARMQIAAGANGCYADFDLSTGAKSAGTAIGTGVSVVSTASTALANGWYREAITFSCPAGSYVLSLTPQQTFAGATAYTGSAANGIYLWGCQLESGAVATSLITTTAAAASVTDYSQSSGANPTANGSAGLDDDVWWIHQKTSENKQVVTFQLASVLDVSGVALPGRQVLANCCGWQYRTWNGTGFDYSNATCPYIGSAMFDTNGNPVTSGAQDKCSLQLISGCGVRYPGGVTVPFGNFPAARRFS